MRLHFLSFRFQLKPLTASVTANPYQEKGSHCGANFWCHGKCEMKYQKLILYLFTNRKWDVLAMNKTSMLIQMTHRRY